MAFIDVLLPVRNGISFLSQSIESIKNQSFQDWRLLILDHGSSDGSTELALKFADSDKRIEILDVKNEVGLAGVLNAGLDKCDCKYVMRQDADDISLPERFKISVAALNQNSDMVVVGGGADIIDSHNKAIGSLPLTVGSNAVTAASFFYNPVAHPTVAINLENFRRIGASYGKDFLGILPKDQSLSVESMAEDYFLFGQIAYLGKCLNISDPLIKYRVHSGSTSSQKSSDQKMTAIAVSRFLMRSLCCELGSEFCDTTPFTTHHENVSASEDIDYERNYLLIASLLRKKFMQPELERELAYRWILTTRSEVKMITRYCLFVAKHGFRSSEYRSIRNYIFRFIKSKYVTTVTSGDLTNIN